MVGSCRRWSQAPNRGGVELPTNHLLTRIVVLAAVLALAGCGGTGGRSAEAVSLREWASNAAIVIHQLRSDIETTQLAGATRASARAALRNESDVYALLVAYTDLAGCRSMVVGAGPTTAATLRVGRLLAQACGFAGRASTLFTTAIRSRSGSALLAAAVDARRALPLLIRAAAALVRVR